MTLENHLDRLASFDTENTSLGVFSRRAFFKLTAVVGVLTFVGSTRDGRIQAWADENGDLSFVVYILSKEEVPIMAFDVSKDKPTPIGGVKVTIVSQVTKKTLTVTTQDNGFAPANVRAHSWQAEYDHVKTYNFRGSIAAVKDGYTEYYVPDNFIEAGTPPTELGLRPNVIVICMRPLDGNLYLRQFTLDGEDIQYHDGDNGDSSKKGEGETEYNYVRGCAVWDDNTMVHDIVAEVVSPKPSTKIEVSLLKDSAVLATQNVTTGTTAPYKAPAKLSGQWLKIFQANDNKLRISLKESGGKTVTVTSPLKFAAPVMVDRKLGLQENFKVCPGVEDADKENKPFAKFLNRPDDTLVCQLPDFPITIFADSSGHVGVSATLFEVTIFRYNSDDEAAGKDPVFCDSATIAQRFTGQSVKDAWNGYWDKFDQGMSKVESSYFDYFDEAKKGLKRIFPAQFTFDFGMSFQVDAMGFGYAYRYGKGTRGCTDIGIKPQFSIDAAVSMQVLVLFIPMYIGIDGSLKLSGMVSTGLEFGEGIKHATYFHTLKGKKWPNMYGCLNFDFEFAPNAGVGVQGLLSAGVRGGAYIRGEIDAHPRGQLPCPHRVFKMGAFFDVTIHILFITKTVVAHKFDPWFAFDNWDGAQAALEDGALGSSEYSSVTIADDDFDYITDDDLSRVVETTATWEEKSSFPTYENIASEIKDPLPDPWAENLYEDEDPREAVNGIAPTTQKLLYKTCFSNPRIRIVHTDTESFKNDRAFLLRVVVAEITPPKTTQLFESDEVWNNGELAENGEGYLVIEEEHGSRYVVPSATEAPANAPDKIYRTRIAVSEWVRSADPEKKAGTWGPAKLVDFIDVGEIKKDTDRLNSYDLDFDVELYKGNLLIAITSMQRPRGEKPEYLEQEANQYLSLVKWDINKGPNEPGVVATGSTFSLLGGGMSLFYPRILMQNFDEGDGKGATLHAVVYSYACTYNETKTARWQGFLAATVFTDMNERPYGNRFSNPTTIVPEVLKDFRPDDLVRGVFEVACPNRALTPYDAGSQRNQTTAVFVWSNPARTKSLPFVRSYVFCETFSIVKKESGGVTEYVSTVNQRSSLQLDKIPFVAKMGVCNQQVLFSFPDFSMPDNRKELKAISFDQSSFGLAVMPGNVGETEKTQYFASFNGRRLYCVRALHYDAPGYNKYIVDSQQAGEPVFFSDGPYNRPVGKASTEVTSVKLYQLCEARWIAERQSYYDFYPIAQLNNIPDNIGVICAEVKYTSFTMATLNTQEDTADIYQVDVPVVLDWESRNAAPVAPFAAPGDMCYYTIEIRNVGNAPITAITMQASTKGTVFEKERKFDKLQDHVLSSPDDYKVKFKDTQVGTEEWQWDLNTGTVEVDEEGNACGEVKKDEIPFAGILWPGRRRTYCFCFKVPTDMQLHGNTTFSVRVVKVHDHMDYPNGNAFEWPADSVVAPSGAVEASDVPLLAAEDYVHGDAASLSEEWEIPMLRDEDDEDWWDDEYEFEISLDENMYYTLDDISYPQIDIDGVDASTKPVATTGDAAGVVAAGATAVAAAAGAAAVKAYRNAQEEDLAE